MLDGQGSVRLGVGYMMWWCNARVATQRSRIMHDLELRAARAFFAAIAGFFLTLALPAQAQTTSVDQLPPEVRNAIQSGVAEQDLRDLMNKNNAQDSSQSQKPGPQTTPAAQMPSSARQSDGQTTLERLYSGRLGRPIRQFGYDLIANGGTVANTLTGAVQGSYVLGPDDQIVVTLRGQENASYSTRVNREGQILLPRLPPISAAGRSFSDFRADLEAAVGRAYQQTQVFISIGEVRQIAVRVVGEVSNPGVYSLTGLSSVLDALNLAGGVKKTGSLRKITVVRGGASFTIDLYSMLLTHGRTPDMTIAQGDRIVVPPIGGTVAVTGDVRRPGIYELPAGAKSISTRELRNLGNGTEIRGVYRETVLRIRADGKEQLVDTTGNSGAQVYDGEVLSVYRAVSAAIGSVQLVGAVKLPGEFSLDRIKTLRDMIPSAEILAPTPYMLLGLIERIDAKTLRRSAVPFSLLHVLDGTENLPLVSGDIVHILTVNDMRRYAQQRTVANGLPAQPADAASAPANATAPQAPVDATVNDAPADTAADLSPEASALFGKVLSDYRAELTGAVRDPGVFLIAPNTTLDELISAAGGLTTNADTSTFEVTSTKIDNATGQSDTRRSFLRLPVEEYKTVMVQPGDSIQFRQVYSNRTEGTVTITGQVRYPGTYQLLRGERLSQVLVRAGGLTDIAYPYGAVFQRETLKQQEALGYQRIADELQRQFVSATVSPMGSQQSGTEAGALALTEKFITEIRSRKPVGRLVVIADPSALAAQPQRDPLMQAGDAIYVPQRPDSVSVLGEVQQPGNYPFASDADADDYVREAGGVTQNAKESMTFVVYPDGRAIAVSESWISFNRDKIPPGSTIYVPTDLTPYRWLPLVSSLGSILKDFAVSAASIAVLGK
ncbi:MAG: hypothetical protein GC166_12110 [Alphaproteobacteria bacterium]|nr:hypothetical protein [Alphaproteobacteria bacterium]